MLHWQALAVLAMLTLIAACASPSRPLDSAGHITASQVVPRSLPQPPSGAGSLPPFVVSTDLPPPQPQYDLIVEQVPVDELLFALARDAGLNLDIIGRIEGTVTLNALDQTLASILERIALQVPIRYRLDDGLLQVEADQAYLRIYHIPYLNMGRRSVSRVDLATQIGSTGMTNGTASADGSNNSRTRIDNQSDNLFWDTLIRNIGGLLGRSESLPSAAEGDADIIVNREAGLLNVRATERQHQFIERHIRSVVRSARRQVLIEATVVEVQLSDRHQAGVDWSVLSADGEGLSMRSALLGTNLNSAPSFSLDYLDSDSAAGILGLTLRALDDFGEVRVLSSPKIIAMNNQTAVLKVVDNRVYFTTSVTITEASSTNPQRETFDTELHTVPIGLVMNVTPFIGETAEVVLNVRPTISRILGFVNDPNPDLAAAGVASRIPEIQVREMESLLRVDTGRIAVIGGLMQDRLETSTLAVPLLSSLPLIGHLFRYESTESVKTELLVFLRPTVIREADIEGELESFNRYLPQL